MSASANVLQYDICLCGPYLSRFFQFNVFIFDKYQTNTMHSIYGIDIHLIKIKYIWTLEHHQVPNQIH